MTSQQHCRGRRETYGRAGGVALAFGTALLALTTAGSPALAIEVSRTTTSLTGTLASPNTMTGTITLADAAPATTYVLIDSFQALAAAGADSSRFYTGTYRFTFSGCVGGTAATDKGPEVIGGGGAYPALPPASSGAPTFTTSPASTSMRCDYVAVFRGQTPPGAVDSLRGDLWVIQDGSVVAQFAGPVVPAPFPPPVAVPETPYAALLPAIGLALFSLALLLLRFKDEWSRRGRGA